MSTGTIKKLSFAEGTSVAAPTDLTISEVIKEFVQYANDAAFESANPGFGEGSTYYNTTSDLIRTYRSGAWTTLAYESVLQTFSNKTFSDPITFTEVATPSTPSAGLVKLYPKSDGNFYKLDDTGVEVQVGSGAGGSGEKNYITNPSAQSALTGWNAVGDLAVARTTTASELPREYTTGTGLKITADADVQSTADYVYYDFTLDDVDLSKKLKIQWSQKTTGSYSAGQLAVVITTQADRTTALHTPITTAIPATDGVFITSFDASTTATLSLVIRATTDMTTNAGIVISDVIVGPGVITQGAVVGDWVDYTPTVTGNGSKTFTNTAKYRRVGNSIEIAAYLSGNATAAGGATTQFTMSLPSGLTIDTTQIVSTGEQLGNAGTYGIFASAQFSDQLRILRSGTTALRFVKPGTASVLTQDDFNVARITEITLNATVPIAEWAGSGTVNLSANNVEYASNSDNSNASSNTTSFAYGPSGSQIPNGATGTTYVRRVKFQTPIQPTDQITLQIYNVSQWSDTDESTLLVSRFGYAGGLNYGMSWAPVSSTEIDVSFYNGGRYPGTVINTAGDAWSTLSSSSYAWRVVKSSSGQAVGFGLATTTSAGLVSKQANATTATTFTFNGSGGTSSSVTLTMQRIGDFVTIHVPLVFATTGTSSTAFTSNTAIPADFRPSSATQGFLITQMLNNGAVVTTPGYVEIATNGIITIARDTTGTAWTNSATGGTNRQQTWTYYVG